MAQFVFNDETFTVVENMVLAEILWIENTFGKDLDKLTRTENVYATLFISMKRQHPGFLTWEQMLQLGPESFEFLPEPPAEQVDQPGPDPTVRLDAPVVVSASV